MHLWCDLAAEGLAKRFALSQVLGRIMPEGRQAVEQQGCAEHHPGHDDLSRGRANAPRMLLVRTFFVRAAIYDLGHHRFRLPARKGKSVMDVDGQESAVREQMKRGKEIMPVNRHCAVTHLIATDP